MIGALATLLIFQLVGEVAVQLSGLPIPGPVVGMVLLLVALRWQRVTARHAARHRRNPAVASVVAVRPRRGRDRRARRAIDGGMAGIQNSIPCCAFTPCSR